MDKVFVVFAREYRTQVRSKAFVISLVLMPILMTGSLVLKRAVGDQVDTRDRTIAVIDHTGWLYDKLAALAEQRNTQGIFKEDGEQRGPRFLLQAVEPADDMARQRLVLSDRVRDDGLSAFVELGPEISGGAPEGDESHVRYYSDSPTDREFPRWLGQSLNQVVQARRFEEARLPADVVLQATRPVPLDELGLLSLTASGEIKEAERTNRVAAFLVPFGLMMLMFMAVMIGATPLLQAIIEEKLQRIAEVLLGSITPFQWMLGKLLGVGAVSLTMISLYLAGGYALLHYYEMADLIHLSQIGWLLAFTVLAILMFGSMFCAIGASCSEIGDAQSLMTPVMLLVVSPMFFLQPILESPSGTLATVASFIPPATPMIMTLRLAIPPGIPTWQPVVGIVGVLAFTALCVFAAGRIFRVGILMQGKTPKLSDMLRWAMRG